MRKRLPLHRDFSCRCAWRQFNFDHQSVVRGIDVVRHQCALEELHELQLPNGSRMHGRTDLHMAFQGKKYLRQIAYASALLSHLDPHLRPLALSRAKHNGYAGVGWPAARRCRIPSAQTDPRDETGSTQHRCRDSDNRQSDQLLPIHGRNITSKSHGATNVWKYPLISFGLCRAKNESRFPPVGCRDGGEIRL